MATIDQLAVSILDMSEQEAFDFVKNLRHVRRTPPDNPKKYKKAKKGTRSANAAIKGSGSKVDANTLAKTLTPEQRAELLKELGVTK